MHARKSALIKGRIPILLQPLSIAAEGPSVDSCGIARNIQEPACIAMRLLRNLNSEFTCRTAMPATKILLPAMVELKHYF